MLHKPNKRETFIFKDGNTPAKQVRYRAELRHVENLGSSVAPFSFPIYIFFEE